MEKVWASACKHNGLSLAYDKSPRFGGKQVGFVRLTKKPYLQYLDLITDADEIKEGHLWGNADGFRTAMAPHGQVPYVVEFDFYPGEKINLGGRQKVIWDFNVKLKPLAGERS